MAFFIQLLGIAVIFFSHNFIPLFHFLMSNIINITFKTNPKIEKQFKKIEIK